MTHPSQSGSAADTQKGNLQNTVTESPQGAAPVGRRSKPRCRPVITIRHDVLDGTLWGAYCAGCRWDGPQRHNEQMARIDLDQHRNQGENQ